MFLCKFISVLSKNDTWDAYHMFCCSFRCCVCARIVLQEVQSSSMCVCLFVFKCVCVFLFPNCCCLLLQKWKAQCNEFCFSSIQIWYGTYLNWSEILKFSDFLSQIEIVNKNWSKYLKPAISLIKRYQYIPIVTLSWTTLIKFHGIPR